MVKIENRDTRMTVLETEFRRAARLTNRVYDIGWLSDLISEHYAKPVPRGPYKKRTAKV